MYALLTASTHSKTVPGSKQVMSIKLNLEVSVDNCLPLNGSLMNWQPVQVVPPLR